MRLCVRDVQYGNVRIEKGKLVLIPLLAMQQDPTEYPNPSQFDPDRYVHVRPHNIFILCYSHTYSSIMLLCGSRWDSVEGGTKNRTYLPFGAGPRFCPAKQFSYIQAKLALSQILLHFKILPLADKGDVSLSRASTGAEAH